ncbi:homocysteine S-methyltransferase 1-like isoform X2 [Coccinella septempunctata]|nr:homocysteine S-methyltransferase 1-like isoform X2 [Coccinella septempunctata]XP_044750454.1 homocysteine S-methyltransferase 1-like isoform X2 [Coccinella septempunctata]
MAPPGIGSSTASENQNGNGYTKDHRQKNLDITILDGGFATQLSCHTNKPIDGDVLWSARFLSTDKEAVINAHLDFLRAGADIIMTNTYQASIGGFVEHLKMSEKESYDLIVESVHLAKIAVERFQQEFNTSKKPLIVGSVGPYGASLHDGSEYTGSYAANTPVETMKQWHLPRIRALLEGGVDLLGLETIPCKSEAEMLVKLLKTECPQTKAWLTFSVRPDGKSIAFGENFQHTAKSCYDLNRNQLVAVGINCVAPRLVETFISGINRGRESDPVPLIVYPNSGESYKVDLGWIDRDKCEPVEVYVSKWLDLGVTWVGGCCRTYAVDVTRIHNEVQRWKSKQREINCSSTD